LRLTLELQAINSAKAPEIRARRVAEAIEMLRR
jgi:hypothetical protein